MTASNGYAVFFFPPALEALGGAIKPYLQDSPAGPHVLCNEIDTGGALLEMTIRGVNDAGVSMQLELMVPTSMVRMIVSSQSDGDFGFGPRSQVPLPGLPDVVAPTSGESDQAANKREGGQRTRRKAAKSKAEKSKAAPKNKAKTTRKSKRK